MRRLVLLALCPLLMGQGTYNLQPRPPARLASLWDRPYEKPVLNPWMLPFEEWEAQYHNYFQRHYHDSSLTFRPSLIVMHYTVEPDAARVYRGFVKGARMDAGDYGLVFGHPSVQLMIDSDGTTYQLLPLDRRCTGAYGVNHKALSIEMVARNEDELLHRPQQLWASFCLVRYLMRQFDIPASSVIAHYEVSEGRSVVKDYLDFADSRCPDRYPSSCARTDPGRTYMDLLRAYLEHSGPAPDEEVAPSPEATPDISS